GIKNIDPPVRLSFSPYLSSYMEFTEGSSDPEFVYKGGMDLKYGINNSYTLDMMLIPDFGQIQSDDVELNLSPFELYHDEKRQFFNEGTELFQRSDVFYSRRMGAAPKFSGDLDDELNSDEVIDYNPSETQLINATKITGRNHKGLAIGVLNAMSSNSFATIKDTIENSTRDVLVQPFTNYNVLVFDKTLKNNSYLSLINSNMSLTDNPFYANTTATEFKFRDKSKTYSISGDAGVSMIYDEASGGYAKIRVQKDAGNFKYKFFQDYYDPQYNPNHMGYLRRNNKSETGIDFSYSIVEPFSIFRELHSDISAEYIRVVEPKDVFGSEVVFSTYALCKNNFGAQLYSVWESTLHDYYEARVSNRFYKDASHYMVNLYAHSNRSKQFSIEASYGFFNRDQVNERGHWWNTELNLRIGQRLALEYELSNDVTQNDHGYVDDDENAIYFSRRDLNTIENEFELAYIFNKNVSLNMRARHYWSSAKNKQFYQLQQNGTLLNDPTYEGCEDENLNVFNIDMKLRWIFAPGSELSFAWKNAVSNNNDEVYRSYKRNLDHTFSYPSTHSFSLKLLYYLDYNQLRK
ncbi:DUF5916 domain-containing protein, partial [bacterium]|nr:DUF5916 domain-containing protein [bacterium]